MIFVYSINYTVGGNLTVNSDRLTQKCSGVLYTKSWD